jgi:MFS family permease
VERSIRAVLVGTFTLRFSTGLTGGMLLYYLTELRLVDGVVVHLPGPNPPGEEAVGPFVLAIFTATFFLAELVLSPLFGLLSDRLGHHRVMQIGPIFGAVAVVMTALTTDLVVLGTTRWLEGASTAASVPSILGFIAMATANDEGLRGRVSARFEAATIAGLGAGLAVAGPVWVLMGPLGFYLNAVIYMVSFGIYRFGVTAPDAPAGPSHAPRYGIGRYGRLLRSSHVWLLAPTWIAVNAAIGLYTTQALFQLVRTPSPADRARFANQALVGGFDPILVSLGFVVAGIVFFAGLTYWGDRFKRYRRTTIIFYGLLGGLLLVGAVLVLNHAMALPEIVRVPLGIAAALAAAFGLFVLAGATPAALGLLADISEAFPDDRGAIMGLYSVFLALGQIIGSLVGGEAAEIAAIDGLMAATVLLLVVALLPLFHLRLYEHRFAPAPGGPQPVVEPPPSG